MPSDKIEWLPAPLDLDHASAANRSYLSFAELLMTERRKLKVSRLHRAVAG
jgi:hypothetical protein